MATVNGLRPSAFEDSFRGKWHRFVLFPGLSLPARFRIPQMLHAVRSWQAARRLKRRGLHCLLARQTPDALPQDSADLLFLYDTVLRRRPSRALELGSGESTLFIAQALYELGEGHLWSLDADARWLDHTRAMLPERLSPFVTFVHSPVVVTEQLGDAAFRYSHIPPGPWDFVFVDGPELTSDVRLSCDLIDLAARLAPGAFGLIDHRWRTAAIAKELAGDKLRIKYMPTLESFSVEPRER
jgi:predicted O-methyltransferase YrrM